MRLLNVLLLVVFSFTTSAQSLNQAQNYLERSNYKFAINFFQNIYEKGRKHNDIILSVTAQNGIAECYLELGANYKSLDILKRNDQIIKAFPIVDYLLLAKTHQLIADNYLRLNLLEDYLAQCHLFYSYYEKAYPNKKIYKALYYAYLGGYYNLKVIMKKSEYYTSNALKIYHKNKKDAYLIDEYRIYLSHLSTVRNTSLSYPEKFKYVDSTVSYFTKRYPFENAKKARLIGNIASINLDLAAINLNVDLKNGNKQYGIENANKAINYYNQAIAINTNLIGFYYPGSAHLNALKGLMYFYKNDFPEAIKNYDEGMKRLTYFNNSDKSSFSNFNYMMMALLNWKSWVLREMFLKNKNPKLLYDINTNLLMLEKVWTRYSHELLKNKEQFTSDNYNLVPYRFLMQNYYELYKLTGKNAYLEKAFEYDEKSKYSALLENLYQQKNRTKEGKSFYGNLSLTYLAFENLILKANSKISQTKSNSYYNQNFRTNLSQYKYEENNSNFSKRNRIISSREIQKKLKDNEVLLSYNFISTQNLISPYALLITKKKKFIIDLEDINDYAFDSNKYLDSLVVKLESNDIKKYKDYSSQIYKKYFKPVEHYIPKEVNHIIIMPDSKLSNIPFEILLSQETRNLDYRTLPYLNNKYQFSYLLSASISKLNDQYSSDNNKFSIFTPSFENIKLSPLALSHKQGLEMSNDYSSQLITGKKASITEFSKHLLTDKIIAVLSHGKGSVNFNNEDKGLYFSDGFLKLQNVYNMKSNCEFLLLGACETALGLKETGEGNINLARAFSSIGVKSMLVTSWKIDEQSTMKVIDFFAENLNEGYTKSEALQRAKLRFLETASPRNANPIYWAGLTIIGNNDSIKLKENIPTYQWCFLLIFPIAGGFLYHRNRKR